MQDWPLLCHRILDHAAANHAERQVVTRSVEGAIHTTNYAQIRARALRVSQRLTCDGVGLGDRIATLAWNSWRHFEAWYGITGIGAIYHTVNPRLFPEQIVWIINHAQDRLLMVDLTFVPLLESIADKLPSVERYIVLTDAAHMPATKLRNAVAYEDWLAEADGDFRWADFDERTAAGLCYTSGTTGHPKGVLYSHRSNVLHSLAKCLTDAEGICRNDIVLPVVPMFHANSWGFPYACTLMGANMVMPSQFVTAQRLARTIESERVTVAGAVPTVWLDLLAHADRESPDLSSLRILVCGGSAVPESLMRAFDERHGVRIVQAWGMTETSPLASVSHPPAGLEGDAELRSRARQGRPLPLVEARIVGDDGEEAPWDGETTGELEVRGPWIAREYYEDPAGAEKFHDGWLRTGDIASMDPDGSIRISDRSKDVIKSGGEWISSVDLENAIMAHPAVREAAVIAMPHERWAERPLACVVVDEGATLTAEELRSHLIEHVAKWWLPDEVAFVEEIPKTSVGKFDKKVLRAQLAEGGLLPVSQTA